jgi:sugar phosphate isomerase/epimerase
MVSCAAEAGYSHLGLRLLPVLQQFPLQYPIIGEASVVREVLRRLADTGIKILDVEFIRLEPDTRIADFVPMLEAGAGFGAQHVLAAGNDADERRLADRLGELCDAAAPFGLAVNLEPIPLMQVRTLAHAARILAAADRPNCGIVIDPIHFDRSRERVENIAEVPRKWLRYLQFCDAPAERPKDIAGIQHQARFERLPPGEGGLDLLGILRALPRDIPIALEIPMTELARTVGALERARRVLAATRTLLHKLDEADSSAR